MKIVVSLQYIQSLHNVVSAMLSDMSITHPYWDDVTRMLTGFNKILARPQLYAITNWVKDG